MKIVDLHKESKETEIHNQKSLESWFENFKKSKKKGHLVLFIKSDNGNHTIEHDFAFDKNHGPDILGCLEIMKKEVMETIYNGRN